MILKTSWESSETSNGKFKALQLGPWVNEFRTTDPKRIDGRRTLIGNLSSVSLIKNHRLNR